MTCHLRSKYLYVQGDTFTFVRNERAGMCQPKSCATFKDKYTRAQLYYVMCHRLPFSLLRRLSRKHVTADQHHQIKRAIHAPSHYVIKRLPALFPLRAHDLGTFYCIQEYCRNAICSLVGGGKKWLYGSLVVPNTCHETERSLRHTNVTRTSLLCVRPSPFQFFKRGFSLALGSFPRTVILKLAIA